MHRNYKKREDFIHQRVARVTKCSHLGKFSPQTPEGGSSDVTAEKI